MCYIRALYTTIFGQSCINVIISGRLQPLSPIGSSLLRYGREEHKHVAENLSLGDFRLERQIDAKCPGEREIPLLSLDLSGTWSLRPTSHSKKGWMNFYLGRARRLCHLVLNSSVRNYRSRFQSYQNYHLLSKNLPNIVHL